MQTIDLDDLSLRCLNTSGKKYIAEAVSCYGVGAYRACIVTTWIAVISDILHKLADLKLTGDKAAEIKLDAFAKRQSDPKGFVGLELEILKSALEFEFISSNQHKELLRVYEDRNKSAHPSVTDPEDIYEPPAELARVAMRIAVSHLLQYPPVQGKAALEKIVLEIKSPNFPKIVEVAKTILASGPLSRPRTSLVKNVITCLIFEYLNAADDPMKIRICSALLAIEQLHKNEYQCTLREKMSQIFGPSCDQNISKLIVFLALTPDCWQYLSEPLQIKLENYVTDVVEGELVNTVSNTLLIPQLTDAIKRRLEKVLPTDLANLISREANAIYIAPALRHYSNSSNYNEANGRAISLILPLMHHFTEEDFRSVVRSAKQNSQIRDSVQYEEVKNRIVATEVLSGSQRDQILLDVQAED